MGIEDLLQALFLDFFAISVIAILVLMHWAEVAWRHIKNNNISKKMKIIENKFDPIRNVNFIKRNDM